MALDSVHPKYSEFKEDWVTMRDLYKGERAVKAKGETYLPPTKGMRLDGMESGKPGREAYDAYKLRAVFHDYVKEGVEAYIGLMWQKTPTIELPATMEALRDKATAYGEPLELLLRRINEEQLVTGRLGLLLDLPVNPDPTNPMPYIAMYVAESIRNWDDGEADEGEARLNLVVLDESGFRRSTDFEWVSQTKYRILQLGAKDENEAEGAGAVYQVGVFTNNDGQSASYDETQMQPPQLRGVTLDKIPFVFVNTKDIVSTPDEPPLLGLGRLALAVYRGEADYRQNLFMQGQDTLVVVGGVKKTDAAEDEGTPLRTGAGSMIEVEQGGDAKYIGVNSQGLSEQRQALENDRKRAETRSGQLINSGGNNTESGSALQTRIGAQTATLNQIAMTGASALESLLKMCAQWMGANPDDVKVTPNLEFADFEMSGKDLVDFMTARTMGAPLSKKSIHAMLVDRGVTKMDFDAEMEEIGEEDANAPSGGGTGAGGDPALEPGMQGQQGQQGGQQQQQPPQGGAGA
jgi:hypothetical protein